MIIKNKNEKKYVKWLKDCGKDDLPKIGGKNANLGELIKARFPVPEGFAITINTYKESLAEAGINKEIQDTLSGLELTDTRSIAKAGEYIRQLIIRKVSLPQETEALIMEFYQELCLKYGIEVPVAVRSSATAEDLPGASFAGQHDTYLWVKGKEIKSSIIKCWASLYTTRAIAYRIKMGFPHEKVFISIGIQKMIDAKASGVMFTLNPTNGDRSKISIGGCWGLGEALVNGEVTPDEWMVDKVVLEITKSTISLKSVQCCVDSNCEKVVICRVPPEKQKLPCLSNQEVIELAKLGKRVEQYFGSAQDIEWALERDTAFPQNLYIVQTRPETVWSGQKASPKLKTTGDSKSDVVEFWLNIKA